VRGRETRAQQVRAQLALLGKPAVAPAEYFFPFFMNRIRRARDYLIEPGAQVDVNRSSQEIYDELLVMRCQRRELAAWDELVRHWNNRLLYYLRRLIDHEQDALNALQEVWLSAFRGIGTLRQGDRFAPWLYAIARRSAMNHFRSAYRSREEAAGERVAVEADDESDERLDFENAELVHFGLGQLGLSEREVLTLFFMEDLTTSEIAGLLQIPVGTVKSRLFKARRDLRRVLEREARHE
jgi:RNA polymerase sigma-70 factor (ECF subfamily)